MREYVRDWQIISSETLLWKSMRDVVYNRSMTCWLSRQWLCISTGVMAKPEQMP